MLCDMKVILICLVTFFIDNGHTQYLKGPSNPSGSWGFWDTCSEGSYASSFQVKVVRPLLFDNEGLSALSFECSDKFRSNGSLMRLWSYEGHHGEWKQNHSCEENDFIVGYRIRYQQPQGTFVDDSATSNVEIECGSGRRMMGEGTVAGNWTSWYRCDPGKAVCGLQTKVYKRPSLDEVGLVTFNTKCCDLPITNAQTDLLIGNSRQLPTESPIEVEIFQASSNIHYYVLLGLFILAIIGFIAFFVGNLSVFREPRRAIEEAPTQAITFLAAMNSKFRKNKPEFSVRYDTNKASDV